MMLSAVLCLASAGVLAWGFATPAALPETGQKPLTVRGTTEQFENAPERADAIARSVFEGHWQRPLRRPLYDPPPPAPKPVKQTPPPPLRARLLATMIEPDDSTAMLELSGREVVFRKVGETLGKEDGDATIAEIQPGTVLVRRGEQETLLRVE